VAEIPGFPPLLAASGCTANFLQPFRGFSAVDLASTVVSLVNKVIFVK